MDFPANPAPSRCTTLSIRNDYSELNRVAVWLEQSAADFGLSDALVFRLDLVLNEALPNIIGYAYPDAGTHDVVIVLKDHPDRVLLEITDAGIPFDPFAREPFMEAASLADATITGRGIHLIRAFTDEQEYCRLANGNTIRLTLYKASHTTRPAATD
jgi:anti-sigma regulatory factor (Ser/Thr protein kinase)